MDNLKILNAILKNVFSFTCLFAFLCCCRPAHAVTEFISTINKTGQDYDTLTLWEAAMDNATDLTDGTVKTGDWDTQVGSDIADATAVTWDVGVSTGTLLHMTGTQYLIKVSGGTLADDDVIDDGGGNTFNINGAPDSAIITAHLYNDDGDLVDNLVIDGLVTDATNYWKVTVPSGERHDGTAGSGAVIDPTATARGIYILDPNTVIEWVEIDGAVIPSGAGVIQVGAANATIDSVIIHDWTDAATFNTIGITDNGSGSTFTVMNSIIYNSRSRGISANSDANIYNTIVHDTNSQGIHIGAGTAVVKNCIVTEATLTDFSGTFDASSDNNITDGVFAAGPDLDSGITHSSGNSGVTVTDTSQNFETTVLPTLNAGEVAWFNNDTLDKSSRITAVIDDNTLTLAEESVTGNSDFFSINKSAYYRTATELYVDFSDGTEDFHLIANAPALDAGADLSGTFTDDIDEQTRPIRTLWDIGADESLFGLSRRVIIF